MIYLFVFFISVLFTYLAQKSVSQKLFFYLFSIIAILFPSLLAGFRNSGIGTDTLVYVDKIWYNMLHINSFIEFINAYYNGIFDESSEFIYLLINWGTSKLGNDVQWIYFTTNLCVILPIYCAIYDHRKKGPMWLSMTIFLLLYYNSSLNLVRQSIALALCVYSYKYLEQGQWFKALIGSVIIMNTHNTGIFYIFIIIFFYINNYIRGKLKTILIFFCIAIIPVVFLMFNYIILACIVIGILPNKYLMYMVDEYYEQVPKAYLLIYFLTLLLLGAIKRYNRRNLFLQSTMNYYIYIQLIGLMLYSTSFVSKWANRIALFFNYPVDCIFLSQAVFSLERRSKSIYHLTVFILILFLLFFWYWNIVLNASGETVPYKSKILGL